MVGIDATDPKAERKAAREAKRRERRAINKFMPAAFGTGKTGYVEVKRDGRMMYTTLNGLRADKEHFNAHDITSVTIETADDYVRRVGGGRVAGGAVVGAVLLGPLGLALGSGAGVLAKKSYGGAEYLIIELSDGRTVTVEVARKHAIQARKLRDNIAPGA